MKSTVLVFLLILIWSCGGQKSDDLLTLKAQIVERFDRVEGDFALAFKDLDDTTSLLLINSGEKFHAASTMKVPVMIELFRRAARGEFSMSDSLMVKREFKSIVDESPYTLDTLDDSEVGLYSMIGEMRSIYDLNYDMIIWSSNLATNILMELADAEKVTGTMRNLGAGDMQILRGVEDQKAYDSGLNNTTTAYDLMLVFEAIANGRAGLPEDCREMINILGDQRFNEIIPALLPEDVQVAHKTGTITALHHDAGLVYLPDGSKYVLVLLSKNLGNFEEGTALLAEISRMIYDFVVQSKAV